MAYNSQTGIISGAVSIDDVKKALSLSSRDERTLCTSNKINLWARYKPIYVSHSIVNGVRVLNAANGVIPLDDSTRAVYGWGTKTKYAYDGTSFNDINQFLTGLMNGIDMRTDPTNSLNGEDWLVPYPGYYPSSDSTNCFFRLSDFVKSVNTNGVITPQNIGYNKNATRGGATVVHQGRGSGAPTEYRMGLPTIAAESRTIVIEDGQYSKYTIPDDYNFLTAFANATDVSVYQNDNTILYYTNFIGENPTSLTVFEIIDTEGGAYQLVVPIDLTHTPHIEGRANATRGVMVLKYNSNGHYDIVQNKCRQTITLNTGNGNISNNPANDVKYYTHFTWYDRGNSLDGYYEIIGDTNSINSTPLTMEVITGMANDIVSGRTDYSNYQENKPNWGTDNPTLAIERVKSAIYSAMIAVNNKNLDFTRKGISNKLYKSGNSIYYEDDSLIGDLLVVEYYAALGLDGTISQYVVIPGYTYKINITRAGAGQTGVDVTGKFVISSILDDYSQNTILYVKSDTTDKNTLYNYFTTYYQNLYVVIGTNTVYCAPSTYWEQDGTTHNFRIFLSTSSSSMQSVSCADYNSITIYARKKGNTSILYSQIYDRTEGNNTFYKHT